MKFSSLSVIQTHIVSAHINSLLITQNAPKSTLSTVHNAIVDANVQKKSVPQQIEASQASPSNKKPTSSPQQFNSIVKTSLLDNKTTISSNADKSVVPISDMVLQKGLTPIIPSESNVISTSMVSILNKESNANNSALIGSTYSHQTSNGNLSKKRSEPASQSTISLNPLRNKLYKTVFIIPPFQLIPVNPIPEIVQKNQSYSCPFCPLEYPSLMFFHAHMRFAHAHSIRPNMRIPQSDQKTSVIECLLCPCVFTDESEYRKHLKDFHIHYISIPNPEEMRETTNGTSDGKNKTKADNNKKNTNPEVIVIDDDDNDNTKNTSNQHTIKVASAGAHKQQDPKVGKLKVKSFAKINNKLSTDTDALIYPSLNNILTIKI